MTVTLAIQLFETFADRFEHSVVLMLVGMLVVFIALAIVGMLLALITRLFAEKPQPAAAAPTHQPAQPAVAAMAGPVVEKGLSPQVLAVISAAVAVTAGAGAKITRIRSFNPDRSGSAWASQGRVDIHSSHAFGKRH